MIGTSGRTSFSLLAIVLFVGVVIFSGCSDSDSGTAPAEDTTDPTVSLSASSNLVTADGDVTFTADASDDEGVAVVEFYDDDTMAGSDDESPYTYIESYTETDNGIREYWARAKDAAGNSGDSDTVEVIVAINVSAEFTNPGFTLDGTGWSEHNFDPWSGWTDEAGNPPGCYRLNEWGNYDVDPGIQQEVSGFIPGLTYEIGGEYRPHAPTYGYPSSESFAVTVDSVYVGTFPRGANGLDWSPFIVEFTATSFTHTIGFWGEHADDSSFELDNVTLSIKAGS